MADEGWSARPRSCGGAAAGSSESPLSSEWGSTPLPREQQKWTSLRARATPWVGEWPPWQYVPERESRVLCEPWSRDDQVVDGGAAGERGGGGRPPAPHLAARAGAGACALCFAKIASKEPYPCLQIFSKKQVSDYPHNFSIEKNLLHFTYYEINAENTDWNDD